MAAAMTSAMATKTVYIRGNRTPSSRASVVRVGCNSNKTSAAPQNVPLSRRAVGASVGAALLLRIASPESAFAKDKGGTYWLSPKDGETVQNPVKIKMGVKGLDVVPAAQGPVEGSGHHHILIDSKDNYVKAGEIIPFQEGVVHYGKGQTETELVLPPGKHKLTLQFANYQHKSYGKDYGNSITINVTE
eukprot:CAMPEP_0114253346 /NCGR_PEP_ID=MMETSP0058-20121206/16337_1 /TAXON_ID=36894 /ORGANISM="Pyramimonas parkeae, CCMP726" /LENGTH=188 /DNA_ID=CAMNT_0001367373 /DNA_START=71 /DNA_END=637 /DNA_ORIENTATION=-